MPTVWKPHESPAHSSPSPWRHGAFALLRRTKRPATAGSPPRVTTRFSDSHSRLSMGTWLHSWGGSGHGRARVSLTEAAAAAALRESTLSRSLGGNFALAMATCWMYALGTVSVRASAAELLSTVVCLCCYPAAMLVWLLHPRPKLPVAAAVMVYLHASAVAAITVLMAADYKSALPAGTRPSAAATAYFWDIHVLLTLLNWPFAQLSYRIAFFPDVVRQAAYVGVALAAERAQGTDIKDVWGTECGGGARERARARAQPARRPALARPLARPPPLTHPAHPSSQGTLGVVSAAAALGRALLAAAACAALLAVGFEPGEASRALLARVETCPRFARRVPLAAKRLGFALRRRAFGGAAPLDAQAALCVALYNLSSPYKLYFKARTTRGAGGRASERERGRHPRAGPPLLTPVARPLLTPPAHPSPPPRPRPSPRAAAASRASACPRPPAS